MKHGTISGYNKGGCRCDPCREAGRRQSKRYYEANKAAVVARTTAAAKRWRLENPEADAALRRERHKRHRAARNEAARRRYHADPAAASAANKRWRERNKESLLERGRQYYEANKGAIAARNRKKNEVTKASARRAGARWVEAEERIVLEGAMPMVEIAFVLGRSYESVRERRNLLLRKLAQQGETA